MNGQPQNMHMDVFISHSSKDLKTAERVQKLLSAVHLEAWLDTYQIRLGVLLRKELQTAIRKSKSLVLIWSRHAAHSRWVAAEILTAFHLKRPIICYSCDETPLPYFLQNSVFLTPKVPSKTMEAMLLRSITSKQRKATVAIPVRESHSDEQLAVIGSLTEGQERLFNSMKDRKTKELTTMQKALDNMQQTALKQWPKDATILNLAGYHYKNAYMLKYWDDLQAGLPPKDKLLEKAERYFFDALFGNPLDASALNGLGSILIYERDYEAAAFFIRKAIALAAKEGIDYTAAKHDLAQIIWLLDPPKVAR